MLCHIGNLNHSRLYVACHYVAYFKAKDSSEFEVRTKTGLVIGHAYGITAVREISLGTTGLLNFFKYDLACTYGLIDDC